MKDSRQIAFSMIIHNHQPVDNDPKIIELLYQMSYLPFIQELTRHPSVRLNLHYTGPLLDWMEKNHPEFFDMLRILIKTDQVCMIGGAYYEPIISAIPDPDALGQIELMKKRIGKLFAAKPRGLWLAERAWEPSLPEILSSAGVQYTALDDTIFTGVGIQQKDCLRPYSVESRGSYVTVFPMLKKLRFIIPFEKPQSTVRFLLANLRRDRKIAVFGDDGEKFGAWPNTYELVYKKKWLRTFFSLLESHAEAIETMTLDRYLEGYRFSDDPKSIHLPAASYDEMMKWSLPSRSSAKARGFWRLFFSKYYESRRMYSEMLRASRIVHMRPTERALQELWKSQCNDAYWHGVFGGLYLPLLRRVTYSHLLEAQRLTEYKLHKRNNDWKNISIEGFYGMQELHIDTKQLSVCVCPWLGGSIGVLSFKPAGLNLVDTLTRVRETYHEELLKMARTRRKLRSISGKVDAKQIDLEGFVYDRYLKTSFADYLLAYKTNIDDMVAQDFTELLRFAGHPYRIKKIRKGADEARIILERKVSGLCKSCAVEKEIRILLGSPSVEVNYKIKTDCLPARFGAEINFACLKDDAFEKKYHSFAEESDRHATEITYGKLRVRLDFSRDVDIWRIPVTTVSQSESGFESNMQSVSFVPNFELEASSEFAVRMSLIQD